MDGEEELRLDPISALRPSSSSCPSRLLCRARSVCPTALGFFFGPLLASLSDVYGRRPFLLVSFLCYAVALALIGLSYSLAGLVIANCLTAAFDSSGSVTYAVVSDMMPTTEFVSMYSLFNAAGSAGLLFGPVFAVASMKVNEHGATFLLASLLALANLAWLAKQLPETLHWRQRLEQSQREVQTDMQEESIDMRVIEDEEEGISSTIDANDHSHLVGDEPASDDAQIHVHLSTISHAYASSSTDEGESAAPSPSPSPSPLDSDPMLQQPAPFSPDRPFNMREIVRLPTSNPFHSVSILWHSGPVLRRLTLAFVLHLLADGALGAIVFLYTAVRWNWGSSENAGMMIFSGAAGVIVMIGVGPRLVRSARFGEERTYRLAQFASIVLQLGFILSPWSWLLLPIGLFGSIGFMWSPTLRARLSRQVPAAQQGELQGAISCVSAIGMTISSVGANALFSVCADKDSDFFFPELVFLVAAIVNLASIAADFGLDTRGIDERGVEGGSSPTAESTNETNIDSSHHTLTTGDTCELSFKLPAAPAEADATSDEDDRALV